jgi:hypothetical protein
LGLHVTQEEIWCWRQRAGIDAQGLHGITCPVRYKSAGDVSTNAPGDWDRIVANGAAVSSTGRWLLGPQILKSGTNCVAGQNPGNAEWTWAARIRDAAFADLVRGTTTHTATVKAELLWQAQVSWANFDDEGHWCTGANGTHDNDPFQIPQWLTRLLFAYDYARPHFSAGEQAIMEEWFWRSGNYWRIDIDQDLLNIFPNRLSDSDAGMSGCANDDFCGALTYTGGPVTKWHMSYTNNRRGAMWRHVALVGIALTQYGYTPQAHRSDDGGADLARLITSGRLFVKELIRHTLWPQGAFGEFCRGEPESLPDLGWQYTMSTLGQAMDIADALARTGDTSLYTYNTAAGICAATDGSTVGTINDGGARVGENRDLLFAMQSMAKYPSDGYARYLGTIGNQDLRIDGRHPRSGPSWHSISEHFLAVSNRYFQDSQIQAVYRRQASGTVAYPSSPASGSGQEPWTGSNSIYPGVLFLFGQLEGVGDPYSLGAAAATCTISAPTAFARYSTATDPLTTVAGTASAGTTSVAWECLTCSPTTGTATGTTSWSIASLGELDVGDNVLTVTPTNSEGPGTPCTLTIQYQTAPVIDLNLELAFPLDTLAGGTTPDSTGHGHTGTISGGVSSVAGQIGSGAALCNGTTGSISASGLLGLQTDQPVTLAAWVKLTATNPDNAEVLSLGDHVALRLSSTTLTGFYYTGSTWVNLSAPWTGDTNWHHWAYTVAPGAQWLYKDGVAQAYALSAAGVNVSGLAQQVTVCMHGNGGGFYLGATVDDVRAYVNRALTGVDIAALANPSTPPTCTVTTPADDPFETDTTPLATFAGTATDDVDVDHVTWTNSLGGGGAASGTESWTVANVPLVSGSQVLTATAHDGDGQTGTCSITVDYTPPPPSAGMGIYTGFTGAGVLRRR